MNLAITQKNFAKTVVVTLTQILLLSVNTLASAEPSSVVAETEASDNAAQSQSTILPGAIEIEGDHLDLYLDRKMRASGNAVITQGDQKIYGDEIEYDVINDELKVNGNARIDLGDSDIRGPALRMRLSESVGEMQDASITLNKPVTETKHSKSAIVNDPSVYIQSKLLNTETALTDDPKTYEDNYRYPPRPIGQSSIDPKFNSARGDAKQVLFDGEDQKILKGARYTTCESGVDDWYIKAREIDLDDYTQYGTAKHAYVEFKGVPILYSPWLGFSFNSERKSGLLAPTVGSTTRSGFEVSTPYYINIAPNKDATVGVRYLSKRGAQLQGEFRYLEPNYSGIDAIEYLGSDDLTGNTRYYANLSHSQNFGNGWSAGYNLEKVSDDQYFSELSTRIISTSRVNLPQQGRVDYSGDVWTFNGLVQKYQTLDDTNFPYERLPQLTLSADKDWSGVTTNLFSQWTYFDRDSKSPPAVTGSRLNLYPSISVPFRRPYGFITPKFGLDVAHYQLNDNNFMVNGQNISNNSPSRTLPIISVDSGLYYERDFRVVKNHYTQTIEPRLYYVYIPERKQDQLPVFDTALTDLNMTTLFTENQFSGVDRVNNANQLSFAVTSKMIDKNTGIERFSATIGQRYYFADQVVKLPAGIINQNNSSNQNNSTQYNSYSRNNSSDIIAGMTARLSNKWNLDAFWQYNTSSDDLVRSNIATRYNPEPGKLLNLSYRYTQDFLEQVNLAGQWPLSRGWYGVGRFNYSIQDKRLIESIAGLEYDAGCWQMRGVIQRVETATANANYGMFFQLELGGLASIGSNPLNLLRRDIPGYLSTSEIPNIYRQQNDSR